MTVATLRRARLAWWKEVLYVVAFYGVYTLVRNTQGSAAVSEERAYAHARQVIRLERLVGLFHEETVQDVFLRFRGFVRFWNVYYGTAHFVVTIGAMVWLYWAAPWRYPLWRNTILATTGLALVGFAAFPLLPPRLLPPSYGFVDTLRAYGGLWSFEDGPIAQVSNQYAAMPSLHFAWSTWCAFVLSPLVGPRRWVRALVWAYPGLTLFAIVVTANHYWLDAVGGAAVLAAGFGLARLLTRSHPADEEA